MAVKVDSGPAFDIAIHTARDFIWRLAEIPFSTVENYIDQGYDNQRSQRPQSSYRLAEATTSSTFR